MADRLAGLRLDPALGAYLSSLVRACTWRVGLALGLILASGLSEGAGLLMLVPLMEAVGLDVQRGELQGVAQFLSSLLAAVGLSLSLATALILYVLIVALIALLSLAQTIVNLDLSHRFVATLRRRLYGAILNTSWLFFSRGRASDFTHLLTTELERVAGVTALVLGLLANFAVTCVYVLLAFTLSAPLTGLAFLCSLALLLLLRGKIKRARRAGEALSQAMRDLHATVAEHLGGMKTARSYGAGERHAGLFAAAAEGVRLSHVQSARNQAELGLWFDVASAVILAALLYLAFAVLGLPTAEVLLLLFVFARVVPRVASLQRSYQSIVNLLPAYEAVTRMEARCRAAAEPALPAAGDGRLALRAEVRLAGVSFAYDEATPVLRDLDLAIPAGKTTVIVGPSGAGKTTIADLVIGLLRPTRGRVLVDGAELDAAMMAAWRNSISYVAQDPFLFHDTVRANMVWALPGASDEEIWEALSMAAAASFVANLPEGLDTVVGDRGARLSGGERQRICLARALLRRPALLILDEATSNLDVENERQIQAAVERLHGRTTILMITHRLSLARGADLVCVLEEGRLVEAGGWDDLLARSDGRFRALCLAQGLSFTAAEA